MMRFRSAVVHAGQRRVSLSSLKISALLSETLASIGCGLALNGLPSVSVAGYHNLNPARPFSMRGSVFPFLLSSFVSARRYDDCACDYPGLRAIALDGAS